MNEKISPSKKIDPITAADTVSESTKHLNTKSLAIPFQYPPVIFLACGGMIILGFLIIIFAILLYPSKPQIPSYQDLKSMQGILTYKMAAGEKKGTYYIGDRELECPEAIRLYPFASCPITIEIKAAEQKLAKAYWYSQSFIGIPYAMVVELIVDKNNNYLNLKGIKILEYQASKEIIQKLHQQRKNIYDYTFFLLIGVFIFLIFLILLMMYYYRRDFKINQIKKVK